MSKKITKTMRLCQPSTYGAKPRSLRQEASAFCIEEYRLCKYEPKRSHGDSLTGPKCLAARGVDRAKGAVLGGRPPRTYYQFHHMRLCRVYLQRANQALVALAAFFLISHVPQINRDIAPRDRLGRGSPLSWDGAICETNRFVWIFDIHYG